MKRKRNLDDLFFKKKYKKMVRKIGKASRRKYSKFSVTFKAIINRFPQGS